MISGDFEDVSPKELQSMADLIMAGHFQSSEKERREKADASGCLRCCS